MVSHGTHVHDTHVTHGTHDSHVDGIHGTHGTHVHDTHGTHDSHVDGNQYYCSHCNACIVEHSLQYCLLYRVERYANCLIFLPQWNKFSTYVLRQSFI